MGVQTKAFRAAHVVVDFWRVRVTGTRTRTRILCPLLIYI
jgi:hypothetical protein